MPKIQSPFVREMINGFYVVTPKINEGYEWVFEDPNVLAIEKLDGTNVSIVIENGEIKQIFNRTNRIPFFCKSQRQIIDGTLEAFCNDRCNFSDGQYFGELVGPKVNGNPYQLEKHEWVPFVTYAKNHLAYKSWGQYPKDFETISNWFKDDIFSLFGRIRKHEVMKPEGVVFTHFDGRMAKLRRDMFDWFEGDSHHKSKAKNVEA